MLREKRKWKHIKYSIKIRESRRVEDQKQRMKAKNKNNYKYGRS